MEKIWDVTIMKMGSIQIGFVIGPCMNASGRLDTAARSLKLLCAETEDEAIKKAEHLALLPEGVNWEDSWNAVDVCKI